MKESECHGLKELIALLAFVYDDEYNALIIDEPELHLHPQFQSFLQAEIRKIAGDPKHQPTKKVFFLITHSPYILDFRVLEDLRNCIIFHSSEAPTYIDSLSVQDEHVLKRLLPRLNTHHKQFFFANRPIFVEGYTDQQLFALIQDSRAKLLGATGACFIDVNGKDEQDFFYRLCWNLQINAQFIADLDLITRGNFRNSISENPHCKKYVPEQGIGADFMDTIRELNKKLDDLNRALESSPTSAPNEIKAAILEAQEIETKRYRILIAAIHYRDELIRLLSTKVSEIDYVIAKVKHISEAARKAGVFILPKGTLENHLPSYKGSAYQISEKAKTSAFDNERDFILTNATKDSIETRYAELLPLLDAACGEAEVNLKRYLAYAIGIFIGNVQVGFERREIDSLESLKRHASVDWNTYSRILDALSFITDDGKFACRMKVKQNIDNPEAEFEFTDDTIHSKFSF
jgi:hypothetical protein